MFSTAGDRHAAGARGILLLPYSADKPVIFLGRCANKSHPLTEIHSNNRVDKLCYEKVKSRLNG